MPQSSAVATTMAGELVSPRGIQERKNTCHPAAIRLQSLPMVSPGETQDVKNTGYWTQRAEVHIEGMLSVNPDSCIFPHIEKH